MEEACENLSHGLNSYLYLADWTRRLSRAMAERERGAGQASAGHVAECIPRPDVLFGAPARLRALERSSTERRVLLLLRDQENALLDQGLPGSPLCQMPILALARARVRLACAEAAEVDAAERSIAALRAALPFLARRGDRTNQPEPATDDGPERPPPRQLRRRAAPGGVAMAAMAAASSDVGSGGVTGGRSEAVSAATAEDKAAFAAAVCVGRWGEIVGVRIAAARAVKDAERGLEIARAALAARVGALTALAIARGAAAPE